MKKVLATREGLVGGITAAGLKIRPNAIFVALPAQGALWKTVRVVYRGKKILAPVLDLGPWFPFKGYGSDSDYVFGDKEPRAVWMSGQVRNKDKKRLRINGAGIDLSDGLIRALGEKPSAWGIRRVEWEFVEG